MDLMLHLSTMRRSLSRSCTGNPNMKSRVGPNEFHAGLKYKAPNFGRSYRLPQSCLPESRLPEFSFARISFARILVCQNSRLPEVIVCRNLSFAGIYRLPEFIVCRKLPLARINYLTEFVAAGFHHSSSPK